MLWPFQDTSDSLSVNASYTRDQTLGLAVYTQADALGVGLFSRIIGHLDNLRHKASFYSATCRMSQ